MSIHVTGTGTFGKQLDYEFSTNSTEWATIVRLAHKNCPEKAGSYMLNTIGGKVLTDVNERCA